MFSCLFPFSLWITLLLLTTVNLVEGWSTETRNLFSSSSHRFPFLKKNPLMYQKTALMSSTTEEVAMVVPEMVRVLPTADMVGMTLREIVHEAAAQAITEKGYFTLAIPGGSILKMLVDDDSNKILLGDESDWTSKTVLFYVNHKCVAMDDEKLATHATVQNMFFNKWKGARAVLLDGTSDGSAEATSYISKIQDEITNGVLKTDGAGFPIFDVVLIGVGDDGHFGSLYPNRPEILVEDSWVVNVPMKNPPSISLTLPTVQRAKKVVIAACGEGKSDLMYETIASSGKTPATFPASGLRSIATYLLDAGAASKLPAKYLQ